MSEGHGRRKGVHLLAVHEAAHVVVAYILKVPLRSASLRFQKIDSNHATMSGLVSADRHLDNIPLTHILAWSIAGHLAEGVFLSRNDFDRVTRRSQDFEDVNRIMDLKNIPPADRDKTIYDAIDLAMLIIRQSWRVIVEVAAKLEERRYLRANEIESTIERAYAARPTPRGIIIPGYAPWKAKKSS